MNFKEAYFNQYKYFKFKMSEDHFILGLNAEKVYYYFDTEHKHLLGASILDGRFFFFTALENSNKIFEVDKCEEIETIEKFESLWQDSTKINLNNLKW